MGVNSAIACKGVGALSMWTTAGGHVPAATISNASSKFMCLPFMAL